MRDPMLAPPEPGLFRFALYAGSHLIGLCEKPQPPVALYQDRDLANSHGARMWPTTFCVIDLEETQA